MYVCPVTSLLEPNTGLQISGIWGIEWISLKGLRIPSDGAEASILETQGV